MELTKERIVLNIIQQYNPFSRWKRLTLDTDFNRTLKMLPEDAYEMMSDYFDKFKLDTNTFDFNIYFPDGRQKAKQLTVRMLLKSAKAGRWLYD